MRTSTAPTKNIISIVERVKSHARGTWPRRAAWHPMRICTPKAQRHQERLRRSSPQISQKDADFEIQIGEICRSLLPFLVSFSHWGGFKATCLTGENLP